MMVTTHVLIGGVLGIVMAFLTPLAPELGIVLGMVGGFVPDIDKLFVTRRTLHYPILSNVAGVILFVVLLPVSVVFATSAALLCFAAGLHSLMEVLGRGGGLNADVSDRAVYNHVTGRWMRATYIVPETSKRELVLALIAATAIVVAGDPWLGAIAVFLGILSVVYALSKDRINEWIPDRYQTMTGFIQGLLGIQRESEWQNRE